MKKQQKMIQMSAYDKQTIHDIFDMTMEWLEKYIEIAGYYPDWENRKQIQNNNIKRTDIVGNPEKAKKSLSSQLVSFEATLEDVPPFFREELKEEFYRWINSTGIDIKNCSEELKHFLFGFNETLEGRGEKIRQDLANRKKTLDSNSPEYMKQLKKTFSSIQDPMRNEREIEKSLEGKTHKDIKIESKFGGDTEQGKEVFQKITKNHNYQKFTFFPPKEQKTQVAEEAMEGIISSNPQAGIEIDLTGYENSDIIKDVKQSGDNWKIENVPVLNDGCEKNEVWLVHKSAKQKYNEPKFFPVFDSKKMIKKQIFNQQEWSEIEQVLDNSQVSQQQVLMEE